MAFQLSPSVLVTEKDLTNVVPAVATSTGATVIDAAWGPVSEPVLIDSENNLVAKFGRPNDNNAQNWLAAANFLAYSRALYVTRTDATNHKNAVAVMSAGVTSISVGSGGSTYTSATVTVAAPSDPSGTTATATATISGGIITAITVTSPGSGYTSDPAVTITGDGTGATATATVNETGALILNAIDYDTKYANGAGTYGEFAAKFPGSLGNSIRVSMADSATFAAWTYKDLFGTAPATSASVAAVGATGDELHAVVVDVDGRWSGAAGTVLETFAFLSKAPAAKKEDGSTAYYKNVLNQQSNFVWWMDHPTGMSTWGTTITTGAYTALSSAVTRTLVGGVDDFASTDGQKQNAFALFANDEAYDINLIVTGKATSTVANYVISSVAEVRKDCVAFVSPVDTSTGDVILGADSVQLTKVTAFRNAMPSTSYAVMDSGYKYQYDRYNDKYRWVPLNGDVAGLCARTDFTDDPWFSPAGLNRGQIKNVVRLAYSPNKTHRDSLYNLGINPVVSFPGQGTVLFGDKTLLSKPSAFDRINVRRLFLVLEKAIATAAKYQLFEFNDGFTRAQFRNLVEPFLRDVKGRRGLTDFKVVCDETNNTSEVIDSNRFVADIFVQPTRSINFITLNFIATRTGASFSEIAGGTSANG